MEYGFQNFMVPRKGLEPLHLAATASKTVMSTIPSPGQICLDLQLFVMYSSRMSSRFAETRTPRVLLHFVQGVLGSMAPYGRTPRVLPFFASLRKGRTSTIPSPGQICLVLEMGLEPTHPKAYASETYVSTIPPPEHIQQTFTCCTCTPLMCRTVSRMLAFGSMALEYSLNARFEPHIYHSTTRASNDSIEKSK